MRLLVLVPLALLAACGPKAKPPETPPMKDDKPRLKTAFPKLTFAQGPALTSHAEAMAWLAKQVDAGGKPKYVRVPLLLVDSIHGTGHDGLARLYDGTDKGPQVRVSDLALGVPLSDHYRRATEREGKHAATSAVMLLTGFWRTGKETSLFPPMEKESDGRQLPRFDVVHVDGPLKEGQGTHAEAER